MELFGFGFGFGLDNVKAEKAKAIFQYNLLKTIQTLFRVTELFLLIILVSWTSFHLPLAIKISCDYFKLLISIIINPFSIFLIGNIIVLCLLFKSRISTTLDKDYEIFQEYFTGNNPFNAGDEIPVPVAETEEVFYEDKVTIYEDKTARISPVATSITRNDQARVRVLPVDTGITRNEQARVPVLPLDTGITRNDQTCVPVDTGITCNKQARVRVLREYNNVEVSDPGQNEIIKNDVVEKNLVRSKSETLERGVNISGKLRRSETEKCRGILKEEEEEVHVFDELSSEEFQNAIETFIAKHLKFHKAEEHAIVLHNQA